MVKKTVTYTDYNGTEKTEDFYFHLNKAELMEMEIGTYGGYAEHLQKIVDAQDGPTIMKEFKDLLLKSYGEKSPDGKHFYKNEELSKNFSYTEAYSQIFMELVTDSDAAAKFVQGILPQDMQPSNAEMQKFISEHQK